MPSLQDLFPQVEAAATLALFGTPERKAIYEPAYHIVMRFVRCTI